MTMLHARNDATKGSNDATMHDADDDRKPENQKPNIKNQKSKTKYQNLRQRPPVVSIQRPCAIRHSNQSDGLGPHISTHILQELRTKAIGFQDHAWAAPI